MRTRITVPDDSLTRLRIALTVFFALDGFVFAGWVVRIPAIKEQTGASASALGLALLGVSAGAVITMMLTGRLCRRYGTHRVTVGRARRPPHLHAPRRPPLPPFRHPPGHRRLSRAALPQRRAAASHPLRGGARH